MSVRTADIGRLRIFVWYGHEGGLGQPSQSQGVLKNASILDSWRPLQNATEIAKFSQSDEVVFVFWVISSSFCGGSDHFLERV